MHKMSKFKVYGVKQITQILSPFNPELLDRNRGLIFRRTSLFVAVMQEGEHVDYTEFIPYSTVTCSHFHFYTSTFNLWSLRLFED